MKYRALLVDDEELALVRLRRLLNTFGDRVTVVGAARNGAEAIRLCTELHPDLLFLDIELGDLSGFEVLEALSSQPAVIFSTAYDQFVIRAFETHAIDYLLKPVSAPRLEKALDKLDRFDAGRRVEREQALRHLAERFLAKQPKHFKVRLGQRTKFLDLEEIYYFQAMDKYVELHTFDGSFLITQSLVELEVELAGGSFVRIHRSVLVNFNHVDEVGKETAGGFYLRVKNRERHKLPLSRGARTRLALG